MYESHLLNQCHLVTLGERSLGLKGKYICRKLHEHVGTWRACWFLQASLVPLRVNTSESGFSEDIFTFQAIRKPSRLNLNDIDF